MTESNGATPRMHHLTGGRLLALALSIALLWFGIASSSTAWNYHEETTAVSNGLTATGQVTATKNSSSRGVTFTTGTVVFNSRDGHTYSFQTPPLQGLSLNETVRVSYLPNNPSAAHEISVRYSLGALFYVGVFFGLFGLALLTRTLIGIRRGTPPPLPKGMPTWLRSST